MRAFVGGLIVIAFACLCDCMCVYDVDCGRWFVRAFVQMCVLLRVCVFVCMCMCTRALIKHVVCI